MPLSNSTKHNLRTPAHGAAVHALVTGTAANHDGAAVRTGRRILLVETRNTADAGHRDTPSWSLGRDRDHLLAGSGLFTGKFLRLLFDDSHYFHLFAVV